MKSAELQPTSLVTDKRSGTKRKVVANPVYTSKINMDTSKEQIRDKITDLLSWCDPKSVQYLYAQGKNLRKAPLKGR